MSYRHVSGHMPWDRTGNRLLIKSSVGQNKNTDYQIPQTNFQYGKNTFHDPQHADVLLYKWKQHKLSSNPNIQKQKDFIDANRKCTKSLIHTAKGFYDFRKSGGIQFKKLKQGNTTKLIKLPNQDFAYGLPIDRQDPIKMVLGNQYGQEDKFARSSMYQTQLGKRILDSEKKLTFHLTKNHKLMKQAVKKRSDSFNWNNRGQRECKLQRFTQVQGIVNTNRKVSAK